MLKFLTAPALILAAMAMPAAAFAQSSTITVNAPANMDEDQARQWQRAERQAQRMIERIANDEAKVMDEESELARAQARLIDAQAKVREEQRELERAENRLAERREELASIQSRMFEMGGTRAELAVRQQ